MGRIGVLPGARTVGSSFGVVVAASEGTDERPLQIGSGECTRPAGRALGLLESRAGWEANCSWLPGYIQFVKGKTRDPIRAPATTRPCSVVQLCRIRVYVELLGLLTGTGCLTRISLRYAYHGCKSEGWWRAFCPLHESTRRTAGPFRSSARGRG